MKCCHHQAGHQEAHLKAVHEAIKANRLYSNNILYIQNKDMLNVGQQFIKIYFISNFIQLYIFPLNVQCEVMCPRGPLIIYLIEI